MEKVYEIATRICVGTAIGFSIYSFLNQDTSTGLKCLGLSAMLYLMVVVRKVNNNV